MKYLYRFKTETEFIEEFGSYWLNRVCWNDDSEMDYLFGTPFPFHITEYDLEMNDIPYLPYDGIYEGEEFTEYWIVDNDMLIINIIEPNYKPKKIIY